MIALLSDPDAVLVWRVMIVLVAVFILTILGVIAVDLDHAQKIKKIKRQQQLDGLRKKEDEACGQGIIDQTEEYHRDFDDAS